MKTLRSGLNEQVKTEVLSTEEVCHHIDKFNKSHVEIPNQRRYNPRACKLPSIQSSNTVVGSMDVGALYPNCKCEKSMKAIEEATKSCGIEYNNIDKQFLCKFVSVITRGKSGSIEIDQFLQIPKRQTTLNSYLKRRGENQFQGPALRNFVDLSPQQVRQLLGIASARTVKNVMMNHFFTINGKLFRQKNGSPIGLDLSVEIASIYMTLWDKKFLATLRRLGIQVGLYKRYVDDTVVILNGINPGWYYCPKAKKMCHDMNHRNVGQEEDARTFGVLREIANSLDTDIQMTVEVPSDFADRRLPVLDLALWVNDNQVQFSFFKKPMSSPYVNIWRSAISKKTKRDSLLQGV